MARNSLKNVAKLIDATKKSLTPEQEFLNDLKRSIEMNGQKEQRVPSKYYKPSGMNCIRAMYYTRVGTQPDFAGSSYVSWGICNSGTDTHERVQKAIDGMKDNGMDCEYINVADFVKARKLKDLKVVRQSGMETHLLHNKLNLSFLCDGIIRYKNHYYILEIKTESSSKWYGRDGVDPGHFNQATCYSIALGLDEVIFLYINRDIFDFKAYLFNVTSDMKEGVIGLIEECDSYAKKMIAPPKPDVAKKVCEYCLYKSICRKEIT